MEGVIHRSVEILVSVKLVFDDLLGFESSDCGQTFQACIQVTNQRATS